MFTTLLFAFHLCALPRLDVVVTPEKYLEQNDGGNSFIVSRKGGYCALPFLVDRTYVHRLHDFATKKPVRVVEEYGVNGFLPDDSAYLNRNAKRQWCLRETKTGKLLLEIPSRDGPPLGVGGSPRHDIRVAQDFFVHARLKPAPVYDLRTGKTRGEIGKDMRIRHLEVSRGGRWIATADREKTVTLFNAKTLEVVRHIETPPGDINALALSTDGKWVAAAINNWGIAVYNCATGELNNSLTLKGAGFNLGMEFTDDGDRLVFSVTTELPIPDGHLDPCLGWWDWKTGDRFVRLLLKGEDGTKGKRLRPREYFPSGMTGDGKKLLSVWPSEWPMLLDLSKAKPLAPAKKD